MTEVNDFASVTSPGYAFFDDPLFLSNSDQPLLQLVNYLFNGTNFITWKRDVYFALVAKNKEGFIDGTCKKPEKTDKKFHQWVRCDLLVMKWILQSIEKDIRDTLQYVSSSKELWTEILDRYGQTNGVEIFQSKKEVGGISQINHSLVEYYGKLKQTWEDLESMDPLPLCSCGVMESCSCRLLKRILDRESNSQLIQFLMGLNHSYDTIRHNVLCMEPLPSINKALGLLQQVERHKQITDAVEVLSEANAYASNEKFDSQNDWKKL